MYPCPCKISPSFCPPKVICANGISKALETLFANKVLPTPGGPTSPKLLP